MGSVWQSTVELQSFPALDKDVSTDVLIVGGGMAGMLTAFMLTLEGVDNMLCEAEVIANGTTKNTTAKLTSQHGLVYSKLIKEFGLDNARLYLRANEDAIESYSALCSSIDADFERKANYIYTVYDRAKLEKELSSLKQIGASAKLVSDLPMPFKTAGAVSFPNQAQFNPLKFLAGISKGLSIFEHTTVKELKKSKEGITAVTSGGKVKAKRIVVATHFPFINKHGVYFLKMHQHRSYVIAIENAPQLDGMFLDDAENGFSFRNYKGLLFIGGGSHRTGKRGGGYAELRAFAKKFFPDSREKFAWAAQDCMTLDSVPYIGSYSQAAENMFVAAGFNKWGMTGSMVAAQLLTCILMGRKSPYEKLFDPSRTILRPTLAANAASSVLGLIKPTVPRCPHLGCALNWNAAENTWDCPCHGSRFTSEGRLIDNPATGDLKLK